MCIINLDKIMASNSEYEQQRFFSESNYYPLDIKQVVRTIDMIWYDDGRMECDNSKVSEVWVLDKNLKAEAEVEKSLPIKVFHSTYVLHPFFENIN